MMNRTGFSIRLKLAQILINASVMAVTLTPLICPAIQPPDEPGGALLAGVVWDRHHSDHADWAARTAPGVLAFDGKMWILGGLTDDGIGGEFLANDVWSSPNGKSWTEVSSNAPWLGRTNHGAVVFNDKMWILGGKVGPDPNPIFSNDVWYSSDGINWELATASAAWSPRQARSCVVFDSDNDGVEELLVIGGNAEPESNEVWSSTDGINWTLLTAAAPWTARKQSASLVFDGDGDGQDEIWVIGGVNNGTTLSDVWRSNDGINWTQVTAAAPWGPRRRHTSVVFDNRMWVMGGWAGDPQHDVWWSMDGQNWIQATDDASWDAKVVAASVVFNDGLFNRLWLIGGRGPNGKHQDVWHDMRDDELNAHQHASTDIPITIRSPKGNGPGKTVTSAITIDDHLRIADINVHLDITHSNDSDLAVFLIHNFVDENGQAQETRVRLFAGVGGSGDNFADTILDDDVNRDEFVNESIHITDFSAPFTGSFAAEGWLRDFDEQDANGTWVLEITDTTSSNDGVLNNWSLDFYGTPILESTFGITVSPASGLLTTESGAIDSFDVVLNSQPTADVTIGISSSNTAEGDVDQTSLTFTPANWDTSQTVTITGVDDAVEDGNQPYTIVTAAATSADPDYNGLDADDVSVTNEDDDGPAGGTKTYSSGNINLAIPDNDPGGASHTIGVGSGDAVQIISLTVTLDISHPRLSDLTVTMMGPDGTEVTLTNFSGDNNVTAFNGTSSQGLWTLKAVDSRKKKTGTINSWSIKADY